MFIDYIENNFHNILYPKQVEEGFMIYVISDIHGMYDKYKEMLDKIEFSDNDILYVLGDVIDRGKHSIKILQDMMERENVYGLIGNHELMAIKCLCWLCQEITDETLAQLSEEQMLDYVNWIVNGGDQTIQDFIKLSDEERQQIINYIMNFQAYKEIKVNDIEYLLVHAGIDHFDAEKSLDKYDINDLVWARPHFDVPYFDDKYVIVGHTPTFMISHKPEIYHQHHFIDIDCGACYPGGKLACLCLDNLEEFYV